MQGVRIAVLGALVVVAPPLGASQETPPANQQPPRTSGSGKHSHKDDFLIHGTVFQPSGLACPGARLRIRRAGEKRFHWETRTNSRGEFAVRVPQGAEYQVSVEAKQYPAVVKTIDGKSGAREESVVLHLRPAPGGKG